MRTTSELNTETQDCEAGLRDIYKALAARVTALTERLDLIERVPRLRHEIGAHRIDEERMRRARADTEREQREYNEAEPKRRAHFEAFVQDRLDTGNLGYQTEINFVMQAFTAWADERKIPAWPDRLAPHEMQAAVLALPGVVPGMILTPVGGKAPGLHGVRIKDEFRSPRDVNADARLINEARARDTDSAFAPA